MLKEQFSPKNCYQKCFHDQRTFFEKKCFSKEILVQIFFSSKSNFVKKIFQHLRQNNLNKKRNSTKKRFDQKKISTNKFLHKTFYYKFFSSKKRKKKYFNHISIRKEFWPKKLSIKMFRPTLIFEQRKCLT